MKLLYFDYNLFNHLQIAIDGSENESTTDEQKNDYKALLKMWCHYNNSGIKITTCEDDSLMEFANYDQSINSYSEIENFFSSNNRNRMLKRFELFKKVKKGQLLICPYGEYGYGSGPFGGGPKKNYELLEQIRIMLNRESPVNPQKDRDARHILHSTLYGCDFCVTMDYTMHKNYINRHKLIESFLNDNNYKINIITPSDL